jgi:hypothetical protein
LWRGFTNQSSSASKLITLLKTWGDDRYLINCVARVLVLGFFGRRSGFTAHGVGEFFYHEDCARTVGWLFFNDREACPHQHDRQDK